MPASGAQREDQRRRDGGHRAEARAEAEGPARTAPGERRDVELGGETGVEAQRDGLGERPCAQLGERARDRVELVGRHVVLARLLVHLG
jgi:hypothetical protein